MSPTEDVEKNLMVGRVLLDALVTGKVGRSDRRRVEKLLRLMATDPGLTPGQRQEFADGLKTVRR